MGQESEQTQEQGKAVESLTSDELYGMFSMAPAMRRSGAKWVKVLYGTPNYRATSKALATAVLGSGTWSSATVTKYCGDLIHQLAEEMEWDWRVEGLTPTQWTSLLLQYHPVGTVNGNREGLWELVPEAQAAVERLWGIPEWKKTAQARADRQTPRVIIRRRHQA